MRAGLFDGPSPKARAAINGVGNVLGNPAHRAIARQAVRESLVLLKNKNQLLPLRPNQHVLLAGDGAHNIGKQSGGWTLSWQGTGNTNADFPGATSIYQGFKAAVEAAGGSVTLSEAGQFKTKPDVAIVVFGENPYAEWQGDINSLEFQPATRKDLKLLKSLKAAGVPVVSVFLSGRPLWVNAELNHSDAFVAAFLPGSEGQGVADVLLRNADGSINHDFKGTLSFSWPKDASQVRLNPQEHPYEPLFPYGYGLRYGDHDNLGDDLAEDRNLIAGDLGPVPLGIFESRVLDPWTLYVTDNRADQAVLTNSQSIETLVVSGHDYMLQDDARRAVFSGSEAAAVRIASEERIDLSSYLATKSSLIIDLRVNVKPADSVSISMACGADCVASIPVAAAFKTRPVGEWQKFSVDLQCFADVGLKVDSVTAPFILQSRGLLDISLANIQLLPESARHATISCAQ
jgi:beta-glucosidase